MPTGQNILNNQLSLTEIPIEIYYKIFSYMDIASLIRLKITNHHFNNMIKSWFIDAYKGFYGAVEYITNQESTFIFDQVDFDHLSASFEEQAKLFRLPYQMLQISFVIHRTNEDPNCLIYTVFQGFKPSVNATLRFNKEENLLLLTNKDGLNIQMPFESDNSLLQIGYQLSDFIFDGSDSNLRPESDSSKKHLNELPLEGKELINLIPTSYGVLCAKKDMDILYLWVSNVNNAIGFLPKFLKAKEAIPNLLPQPTAQELNRTDNPDPELGKKISIGYANYKKSDFAFPLTKGTLFAGAKKVNSKRAFPGEDAAENTKRVKIK